MERDLSIMSFGDHLEELRRRLIFSLLGPIPIFVVCLIFGGPLLQFLIAPAEAQLRAAGLPARLLATSPAEPFIAYLKVATIVALIASGPWILFQLWLFVAPGLYAHERRFAYFLLPFSAVLTFVGTAFLYLILLPITLRFFIMFGMMVLPADTPTAALPEGVTLSSVPVLRADPEAPMPGDMWINDTLREVRVAIGGVGEAQRIMGVPLSGGGMLTQQYKVSEYIGLVFRFGLVFAVAFQLPLVMMLAGWLGVADWRYLGRYRKHTLFVMAIVSAAVTPADPASMILLMIPLYMLFEFGLVLMRFVPARVVAGKGAVEGGGTAESGIADEDTGPDDGSKESR